MKIFKVINLDKISISDLLNAYGNEHGIYAPKITVSSTGEYFSVLFQHLRILLCELGETALKNKSTFYKH